MRTRLDTPWPLQKIIVRATPHRLAYYAEARLYVLLVSRPVRQLRPAVSALLQDVHAALPLSAQ